ncbi:odorant receptor 131-2-like [Chanos chanos]|uniref:Odorant receptor 131-2-like n=1 Tax=Chanos chanos TaxID=29144 RepID=A0A6J2VUT9_CHACN|nr:odorant receptor 131-2-like [Chanos chanos]
MNSTINEQAFVRFEEMLTKNVITIFLGVTINSINGMFVFTFVMNSIFYSDPRYILYIHLVINDMIMTSVTVFLYMLSCFWPFINVSFCCILLIIASATHKNTPLTLAGMAIERYIAVCRPLHHPQICTVRRTRILIGLIWGVGLIPGVTDLIIVTATQPLSFFSTVALCRASYIYNTIYHIEKNKAVQGIYMLFVWMVLVFTYCKVLVAARKVSTNAISARKAQSTILLHGAQLMLCMLSYITPILDLILVPLFPMHQYHIFFFNYLLTNIIPRLLTPLIYGVRDQKFAAQIKAHFSSRFMIVTVEPAKSVLDVC